MESEKDKQIEQENQFSELIDRIAEEESEMEDQIIEEVINSKKNN